MTIQVGGELFGTVYEKGSVIFCQGEPGDAMYIIQSGAVEVSCLKDNKEVVLALLERGEFFGEMALLDEQRRSATVVALHRTRLLPIARSSFMERVRQDPSVTLYLLKIIGRRIEKTNNLLKKTAGVDASLGITVQSRNTSLIETAEELSSGKMSAAEPATLLAIPKTARSDSLHYKAGQTIFTQGDYGDSMYLVMEGLVDIIERTETGDVVLASFGPGDFFGEMSLIMDAPRTATALAGATTYLLRITKDSFLGHMRKQPELALFIIQSLIRRLRRTISLLSLPQRSLNCISTGLRMSPITHSRLRIAIISLTTCGGCATALMADRLPLLAMLERTRVSYCPMLMDKSNFDDCDIAIVDGIVRLKEEAERLQEIRHKSHYLLAWGTCATLGGVPALANQFEIEDILEESYRGAEDVFSLYLSGRRGASLLRYQEGTLALIRKAGGIDDYVKVDYYLPGCPPQSHLLLNVIKELRNEPPCQSSKATVCGECTRQTRKMDIESLSSFPRRNILEGVCFVSQGVICTGFLTRGGCDAVCTSGGLPCWGCRGPSDATLRKIEQGTGIEQVLADSIALRCHLQGGKIRSALKSMHSMTHSVVHFYHNQRLDRKRIR